jgi:hypothetical protein
LLWRVGQSITDSEKEVSKEELASLQPFNQQTVYHHRFPATVVKRLPVKHCSLYDPKGKVEDVALNVV